MICSCAWFPAEFYAKRTVRARKQHCCDECFRTIQPGEKYECVSGKWDGEMDSFKTCPRCLNLREYVESNIPCFCWQHGSMIEDAIEHAKEYAHELPGLLFGAWRRQVMIEKNKARGRR